MPTIDGAALKELLSNPPVLGALAALLVVLVVLAVMRAGVVRRLLLAIVGAGNRRRRSLGRSSTAWRRTNAPRNGAR